MPIVASITKSARTVTSPGDIAEGDPRTRSPRRSRRTGGRCSSTSRSTWSSARRRHRTCQRHGAHAASIPTPTTSRARPRSIAGGRAPAIIVGQRRVLGRARGPRSPRFVEAMRVPCSFNGLGRGCLPADHELAFTRHARPAEDRRRSRGGHRHAARLPPRRSGGSATRRSCTSCDAPESRAAHVATAASPAGDLTAILDAHDRVGRRASAPTTSPGSRSAATPRRPPRRASASCSRPEATRSSPTRVYGELGKRLGARRGRDLRRRRLRVVRGQVRRGVHAGLLARHRSLRVPRQRAGLRDGGAGRPSRRADRRDARRRRRRVLTAWTSTRSSATTCRS